MPPLRKYIYDPIHGSITLTGPFLDLVGHPLLQRLWGIRQTGLAHLVFPGSGHSRLEHCLGTMWVARAMGARLDLDPSERDPLEIAGLLHDIGHPPFSHSMEGALHEITGLNHEGWTDRLIRGDVPSTFSQCWHREGVPEPASIPEILERHGIRTAEVTSRLSSRLPAKMRYVGEMLHGTIDADRLDYMERDAHYTGVAHGAIDANRILETLRVAGNRLAFAEKGRTAVEGFLLARSLMYASVYYNKTVRIAESMILSAVERFPGYPASAMDTVGMNDGELLASLQGMGGRPRDMAVRIRVRDLYKRAVTLEATKPNLPLARKLVDRPVYRRELEDALAQKVHGAPGDVLLDPIARPGMPDEDVLIIEDGKARSLLEDDPNLSKMIQRHPTRWCVAMYTHPRHRRTLEQRGEQWLEQLS